MRGRVDAYLGQCARLVGSWAGASVSLLSSTGSLLSAPFCYVDHFAPSTSGREEGGMVEMPVLMRLVCPTVAPVAWERSLPFQFSMEIGGSRR